MDNYKPECGMMGDHTVEVTLQYGEYKGTFITEMGGNCKGGTILGSFTDLEYFDTDDITENNCSLKISDEEDDEGNYWFQCTLVNEKGDTLEIEEEAEYLNNYIVGVNIIDFEGENND